MRLLGNMVLVEPQEHKAIRDHDGGTLGFDPPMAGIGLGMGTVVHTGCNVGTIAIPDRILYTGTLITYNCPESNKTLHLVRETDIVAVL